ncbi:MAG: transketolase [Candidatus Obscuribacterales bacterium]|nr:transketolase [Candidatus Obscuribacterales bacterium]
MVEVQTDTLKTAEKLAFQLRVDSIRSTTQAGSGHPTSCMSAADLMSVLLTKYLKFDFNDPALKTNDRLVFSKGHAAPLLYSMYKAAGAITDEELMTLRKFGSRLEGHPIPEILPYVEVATGSLGQGLPMAVGIALNGRYLDKLDYRTWVLLGDSEMAEGSIWEAMACASHYKLDNLTAILDMNRLGQRGETALGWNSTVYAERARSFGWHAVEINGHNLVSIDKALQEALANKNQPTLIIAKTDKGHGFPLVENKDNWHGKPLSKEQAEEAVKHLGGEANLTVEVAKPEPVPASDKRDAVKGSGKFDCPSYQAPVATREAYGDALKALGDGFADVVVLDAEVSNSTFAEKFSKAHLDRFFEMYIAEQLMVGVGCGLANRGKKVFASTFAAFLARAYDFIRMAAVSRSAIKLCGSHAGCSIGQDGPSQMALEDLAMFRSLHGSTVLYPCDGVSTARLVYAMKDLKGISYLRSTRAKTRIIYGEDEEFPIGGSKVLRQSKDDQVTLIGAGITLHECLTAYDELKTQGIDVRVIDLYSIKPIDRQTLYLAAKDTEFFVTVEDHWPEGGLGDAVLEAFSSIGAAERGGKVAEPHVPPKLVKLAVRDMPGSGEPEELMDAAGITASHIVRTVKSLIN